VPATEKHLPRLSFEHPRPSLQHCSEVVCANRYAEDHIKTGFAHDLSCAIFSSVIVWKSAIIECGSATMAFIVHEDSPACRFGAYEHVSGRCAALVGDGGDHLDRSTGNSGTFKIVRGNNEWHFKEPNS